MPVARTVALLAVASILAFPRAGPADDAPAPGNGAPSPAAGADAFSASIAVGMAYPGAYRDFVFTVDRWTGGDEGLALSALQAEKGTHALFARLAAAPVGTVRRSPESPDRLPGGWTRQYGSGEIYAASALPSPTGGRTVRLLTKMRFVLADGNRRYGEQLGLLQLELDEKGKGLGGTLIPAFAVPFNSNGRLDFDSTPFPKDTYELVGVRADDGRGTPNPKEKDSSKGECP